MCSANMCPAIGRRPPTKSYTRPYRQHRHGRAQYNQCSYCAALDTLEHRIASCRQVDVLWLVLRQYLAKWCHPQAPPCLQQLQRLEFRLQNRPLQNCAVWLVTGTLHWILKLQTNPVAQKDWFQFLRQERWRLIISGQIGALQPYLTQFEVSNAATQRT